MMMPDPAILETTQCLCMASRRAARAITRQFDEALRVHGLRATQFTLLAALHLAGPRSVGEMAELLGADRTTLTRNLAVAEASGWVAVRTDRDDARSRRAKITAQGTRMLVFALPSWRKTQQRLTNTIGKQTAASLRMLAGGPCVSVAPATARSPHRKEIRR